MDQSIDARIYNQKGRSETQIKDFKAAIVCYSRAIRSNKNHIPSLDGIGEALFGQQKYKEALLLFRRVAMMKPNDALSYSNLGIVLDVLGKTDESLKMYKEAIRLDPNSVDAHFNLAILLMTRERYEEAEECYLKAEELEPSDGFLVSNGIGCLYFMQGMFSKATKKFQESISMCEKYTRTHWNMSLVLFCENKSEEALKYFEDGLKTLEDEKNKINTIERIIESYVEIKTRFVNKSNDKIVNEEQLTLFKIMIDGLTKIINLLTQHLDK